MEYFPVNDFLREYQLSLISLSDAKYHGKDWLVLENVA